MPPVRRIAAMFDADLLTLRDRETLRGIERYARAAGWRLVLDPYALHHQAAGWDGLLVPTRKGSGKLLDRCAAPVVCLTWSQRHLGVNHAVENRYAAGRLAARHLVERGYRSFAYVGFQAQVQSHLEREWFQKTLRGLGRRVHSARTFTTYASMRSGWDKVMGSLGEWLDHFERPVGLFVARPGLARALAEVALARGLRIPEDLGLVAADDEPLACELPPALTSLRFDYAEVGHRAAQLLDRLMDRGAPPRLRLGSAQAAAVEQGGPLGQGAAQGLRRPRRRAILIPPTLVPRQSTDRQATGDPVVANALWFIDDRRTEPIRPAQVAASLGVGERALQRRFRRAGRDTVQQEILKARVEHAKLHLADDPRGTMHPVARLSGFGSYEAMFRAFKRHTGMAPSAWRRRKT